MIARCLNLKIIIVLMLFGTASSDLNNYTLLFNGNDLSGWMNVIGAKDTWSVVDESIQVSGTPRSILRTDRQYENYILELDYRAQRSDEYGGIIIHSDALPAVGKPWPKGINIHLGRGSDFPVISPIGGAKIEPVSHPVSSVPRGSSTAKGWTHCRIESRDGHITLKVNGQIVSTANHASPRKGYIALKSDGTEIQFKNIRIKKLRSTNPASYEVAASKEGFVSLYNGTGLSDHWHMKSGHCGHWTARDWVIDYDGASEEQDKSLWSKKKYRDFILIADMKFTRTPKPDMVPVILASGNEAKNEDGNTKMVEVPYAGDTGIYLRGSSKNQVNMGNRYIGSGEIYGYRVDDSLAPEIRRAVVPRVKVNNQPGEWDRYIITMEGQRISVELNGWLIIDSALLPGIAEEGKIALQDDHAKDNRFQFGNLYIKELE